MLELKTSGGRTSRMILRAVALTVFVCLPLLPALRQAGQSLGQGAAAGPAIQPQNQGDAPAVPGPARGGGRGARGARGGPAPPVTGQASATNDLTGYWVRLVTEDWRWLMVVPGKGDASSIPLNQAGTNVANTWDPAKDEAEGNQCKGYGAGAISRLPTRAHVTWQDPNNLKWETDQGMQTRLFKFGSAAEEAQANPGARTWQGVSVATWEPAAGGGRGGRGAPGGFGGPGGFGPPGGAGGPAAPGGPPAVAEDTAAASPVAPPPRGGARGGNSNGWLKVVTTNVKPGYLRKNGLPYSDKATITEYFQPTPETYGIRYMIVTTIVEDPEYLNGPLITSSNYKKLSDTNNGWDPQPCSVK